VLLAARLGLTEALAFMRSDITLIVWRLTRLGRSPKQLIKVIQDKGVPTSVGYGDATAIDAVMFIMHYRTQNIDAGH